MSALTSQPAPGLQCRTAREPGGLFSRRTLGCGAAAQQGAEAQQNLGQASLNTTTVYVTTGAKRRMQAVRDFWVKRQAPG